MALLRALLISPMLGALALGIGLGARWAWRAVREWRRENKYRQDVEN